MNKLNILFIWIAGGIVWGLFGWLLIIFSLIGLEKIFGEFVPRQFWFQDNEFIVVSLIWVLGIFIIKIFKPKGSELF